jgi:hypothetical protein
MERTSAPGIGCFVPQLPPDPPDVTVLCGTCGFGVWVWSAFASLRLELLLALLRRDSLRVYVACQP